jgi:predicted MarR family transcription regulator
MAGCRAGQIWQALQATFALSPQDSTLNQLRYDLRKMRGHGLLERVGKQYGYRLTEKGARVAVIFVLFHW